MATELANRKRLPALKLITILSSARGGMIYPSSAISAVIVSWEDVQFGSALEVSIRWQGSLGFNSLCIC